MQQTVTAIEAAKRADMKVPALRKAMRERGIGSGNPMTIPIDKFEMFLKERKAKKKRIEERRLYGGAKPALLKSSSGTHTRAFRERTLEKWNSGAMIFTSREAALLLDVKCSTIRGYLWSGRLEGKRIGNSVLIPRSSIAGRKPWLK